MTSGTAVVGFTLHTDADGTQTLYSLCATTHLTDFSGVAEPEVPAFNVVDPIGDAGMLTKILDPGNMFPTLSVFSLVAFLMTVGICTGIWDKCVAWCWRWRCVHLLAGLVL